jgi:hypothetical protein
MNINTVLLVLNLLAVSAIGIKQMNLAEAFALVQTKLSEQAAAIEAFAIPVKVDTDAIGAQVAEIAAGIQANIDKLNAKVQ